MDATICVGCGGVTIKPAGMPHNQHCKSTERKPYVPKKHEGVWEPRREVR